MFEENRFLSDFANHLASGKRQAAVDFAFDTLHDWLRAGENDICDRAFQMMEPSSFDATLCVTLLSATYPWRSLLPERTLFLERVRNCFASTEDGLDSTLDDLRFKKELKYEL